MWHEVALDANALDYVVPVSQGVLYHQQLGPHRSSRAMAFGQIAVFEVVNARYKDYASFSGFSAPGRNWSVDAAVAQAGHDALVFLYPPQTANFDSILATDLLAINDSAANIAAGRQVGAASVTALHAKLGNDNTTLPEPSIPANYQPSGAVGEWDIDPVSKLKVALGGNWSKVIPFTFANQARFRAPPPPAVGTPVYKTNVDLTKTLGGDPLQGTVTTRTPYQTFISKFWSYDGTPGLCAPPRLYNQIARQLALSNGLTSPSKLAKFLALINVGMADAAVSAWEAKFYYKYWRPVTAIRRPGQYSNDPNWYPIGAQATNSSGPNFTPPFPAYPSGHATFGGTLFEILRKHFGDIGFTFVSDEFNGLNKDVYGYVRPLQPATFTSLTDAETSNAESRIYDGVHWQFDADAGITQGREVARHAMKNFAKALDD